MPIVWCSARAKHCVSAGAAIIGGVLDGPGTLAMTGLATLDGTPQAASRSVLPTF